MTYCEPAEYIIGTEYIRMDMSTKWIWGKPSSIYGGLEEKLGYQVPLEFIDDLKELYELY